MERIFTKKNQSFKIVSLLIGFLFFTSLLFSQSPGDIIITEVGPKKGGGCSDPNGEWWEIYNTTDSDIDLTGWRIDEDGGSNDAVITAADAIGGDVIIEAGTFYTFGYLQTCVNTNYQYGPNCTGDCSNMSLSNCNDGVQIKSPDGTIISYFLWNVPGCGLSNGMSLYANNVPEAIANGGDINADNVNYGLTNNGSIPTPGGVTSGQILPVELISFKGNIQGKSVKLFWQTVSEINNEGFYIEKSNNGKIWEALSFIAGKGNSNKLNTYQYEDTYPYNGINYYRLKQMDFDGRSEYSNIVTAELKDNISDISIYPNPTKEILTITSQTEFEKKNPIRIFDLAGRLVSEMQMPIEEGENKFVLNVEYLESGIYFIQLQESRMVRFIKE